MIGSGTEWTVPGQGSSLGELLDAIGDGCTASAEYGIRTDLLLTGKLLDHRDRVRIREEIGQARARIARARA